MSKLAKLFVNGSSQAVRLPVRMAEQAGLRRLDQRNRFFIVGL